MRLASLLSPSQLSYPSFPYSSFFRSITAAWAISSVIAYRIKPHENIAVFFTITFGRLYTLTMLSNLNMRDSLARESQTSSGRIRSSNALALGDVSGGRGRSNFGGRGGSKKGTGAESQHGGVQIHREQVTHFEINDPEFEQGIAVPSVSSPALPFLSPPTVS